jgi:hypothetical protein
LSNLISSVAPQEQRTYYQGSPDVHNFPRTSNEGAKSPKFNTPVRSQYPNSRHTNPNLPPQSSSQTWNVNPSQNSSQPRHDRYFLNSNNGNGNLNVQSQNQSPKYQPLIHAQRRQSQPLRPQVRLPNIHDSNIGSQADLGSHVNQGYQANQGSQINHASQVNHDFTGSPTDLKTRSPPSQNKDFQSKPHSNSFRRHRNSTSNSSKTSTGSVSWEPVVSSSPASTQLSSSESSTRESSRQSSKPRYVPDDIDKEWLLLRAETLSTPREVQEDKYGHVHPLIRKYASQTIPELKMGEPRWANAVMSRRWQREETLEQEKKEMLAKREPGIELLPSRPPTCMTKKQDEASRVAEQTLAMLKEMDMEKNQENIDNISGNDKM